MPRMHKDPHSGAILFTPTPEEQEVSDLKQELATMKEELSQKLQELNEALKTVQKPKK